MVVNRNLREHVQPEIWFMEGAAILEVRLHTNGKLIHLAAEGDLLQLPTLEPGDFALISWRTRKLRAPPVRITGHP